MQMNKIQLKQSRLKKDYMKLYKKLDMYGQAPMQPLFNPWQRDIRRLEARWKTVKSYKRIYQNYVQAVAEFNATYKQNVQAVKPHTAINTRTLETMKRISKEFRKQRKWFIKKIRNESDIIYDNFVQIVKSAYKEAQTTHINSFNGQLTPKGQDIVAKANRFNNLIQKYFPQNSPTIINKIKQVWTELITEIEKFIYQSEQFEGEKAVMWQNIVFIISGGNEQYNPDSYDLDFGYYDVEDFEYYDVDELE